jgi:hypothetical protein
MNHFLSIRELLNTLSRENKLLSELFEKRKSLSYKYDYALELVDNDNDRILRLIEKSVIRQNGNYLEIDDQFLQFFEQILEVNEEINISYINENIEQVKQYILYYLQENSENRKYTYLKSVKSTLKKIGRITIRNIVDLNRNIENTFKTEPNYKIKISKLENHNRKLTDIKALIEQTEKLITEDELTFFKAALDEELKSITNQLRLQLSESRHNLIEAKKQIIEFINQIKYQSKFIEKLRQIKYLKDQFELRAKTNIIEVLVKNSAMAFEIKPTYPLKLSLDWLQQDEVRESILKINQKIKSGVKPLLHVAESISNDYLQTDTEKEIHINLEEVRNNFMASGNHLFDFILNYKFPRDVLFEERITVFCQMISIFDNNFEVSEDYNEYNEIEYVMVFPKKKMK